VPATSINIVLLTSWRLVRPLKTTGERCLSVNIVRAELNGESNYPLLIILVLSVVLLTSSLLVRPSKITGERCLSVNIVRARLNGESNYPLLMILVLSVVLVTSLNNYAIVLSASSRLVRSVDVVILDL